MGKRFGFQLKVTNPCTENWDNMTPQKQGRHCDSCNKTVVDFTQFTDKQLIDFFKKVTDNICGRATKYQLQRQMVYTEPSKHPLLSKFVFGTTLLAGLTTAATAQQNGKQISQTHQLDNKKDSVTESIETINPAISQEIPYAPPLEIMYITETSPCTELKPEELIGVLGGMTYVAIPLNYIDNSLNGDEQAITDYVRNCKVEMAVKPGMALNVRR